MIKAVKEVFLAGSYICSKNPGKSNGGGGERETEVISFCLALKWHTILTCLWRFSTDVIVI